MSYCDGDDPSEPPLISPQLCRRLALALVFAIFGIGFGLIALELTGGNSFAFGLVGFCTAVLYKISLGAFMQDERNNQPGSED